MRVAYLMQAGVPDIRVDTSSGPSIHVRRVIEKLKDHGNEVRLLAQLNDGIWASDNLERYAKVRVRWLDQGPIRWFERLVRRIQFTLRLPYLALFDSVRFALACRQVLDGYDLLYERMGWMGYGGSLASRMMKIPLVLEVNGDHLSELEMLGMEPHGAQRLISIWLMKLAARQASHTVATGEGWRRQHIRRWDINPARVTVVENGTDIVKLLDRHQLHCFQALSETAEPVRLIYVGAFEPWHGLKVLIRAIARAVEQGIVLHATLVGKGSQSTEIERLVRELRMEAHVALTGRLQAPQIALLLANADIGLSPYCGRVEYSGLKLLDYKAAGLATIASGENGQPAVIEQGCTGVIVPPCDEDKLVEAIVRLGADRALIRRMGREARIEAERRHGWSQTASELQGIFSRVLG